jgi:hypothetical protein
VLGVHISRISELLGKDVTRLSKLLGDNIKMGARVSVGDARSEGLGHRRDLNGQEKVRSGRQTTRREQEGKENAGEREEGAGSEGAEKENG